MFNLKHNNTKFTCSPTIIDSKNNSLGFICKSSKQIEGFQNLNIPGLTGWFDSKDPYSTGMTATDGTIITTWKDKSDNKNDFQAKVPGKFINGGIKFSKSWYQSIKPHTYPIDVYVVLKLDGLNVHNDIIGLTEINKDNFNSLTYSEFKKGYWHNGSSNFSRTGNAVSNLLENSTDKIIMGWSIGNNNFKIYRNGVQIMSTNSYQWNTINPYLQLGNRLFFPAGALLNGTIYEVMVYNRQINDDERANVFNYLTNKWLYSKILGVPAPAPAPAPVPQVPQVPQIPQVQQVQQIVPQVPQVVPQVVLTSPIVDNNQVRRAYSDAINNVKTLDGAELQMQKNLKIIIQKLFDALSKPNINEQVEILLQTIDTNLNSKNVNLKNEGINIINSMPNSIQNVVDNSIKIIKSNEYKSIISDVKTLLATKESANIMRNYQEILRKPEINQIITTIKTLLDLNYSKIRTLTMSLISLFDEPNIKKEWVKLLIMLDNNLNDSTLKFRDILQDTFQLIHEFENNPSIREYFRKLLNQPLAFTLNRSAQSFQTRYRDFHRIIIENFIRSFIVMIDQNKNEAMNKIQNINY